MASTSLSVGVSSTLTQNKSYALPAKLVVVTSNLAVQTSVDETTWNALPNAETAGAQTGASFIRCAVGNAVVICKEAGKDQSGWNTEYISMGSNPAQSGAIRLSPDQYVKVRFNNTDYNLVGYNTNVGPILGDANLLNIIQGHLSIWQTLNFGGNYAQSGTIRLANNQSIKYRNAANTADVDVMNLDAGNNLNLGLSGVGAVGFGGARTNHNKELYLTQKIANPGAPGANGAFIWLQDNGSGKAQLMVRFATGTPIQLAIEP